MSQDFAHAFDKLAAVGLGHVGELVVAASKMTNRFEEIHIYNRDSRLVNQRTKSVFVTENKAIC